MSVVDKIAVPEALPDVMTEFAELEEAFPDAVELAT